MKAEDIRLEMLVYCKNDRGSTGTVKCLPDADGNVNVKWKYDGLMSVHFSELEVPNSEVDKELAAELQGKIDKAKTAFEVAFEALEDVKNARNCGYMSSFQDEGLINVRELEKTIDNNGWSSSSLWC